MSDERLEAKPRFSTEYGEPPKRRLIVISKAGLVFGMIAFAVLLGLYLWGRWMNPYGARPCRMPCVWSSLQWYARDHSGWYPQGGETPLQSLQLLYPRYCSANLLAGISGPEKTAQTRLDSGGALDETVSSWVYVPGFKEDDWQLLERLLPKARYHLALIWERQPGVSIIGTRVSDRKSHAVGFVGAYVYSQVSGAEWDDFLKEQKKYRQIVLDFRAAHPTTTNANPKAN